MKKFKDLLCFLLIYIFAFAMGVGIAIISCVTNIVLKVFIFDVVATIIVYFFSVILNNSSVYDAYWSVLPLCVIIYLFVINRNYGIEHVSVMVAFLFWAFRLTINWIIVTSGFSYEDWRYKHYREKANGNKFLWFIFNFFGIHLIPTIFVFLGMLPMFDIFAKEALNNWTLIGIYVMLAGALLQLYADKDMHYFLNTTKEKKVCSYGLWNYSRHPNYLGEITVWFGLFLTMIVNTQVHWYYAIGFIGIAFMFNVISIPLMEKRQVSRRPDYKDYQRRVHRLFILPNKKVKN